MKETVDFSILEPRTLNVLVDEICLGRTQKILDLFETAVNSNIPTLLCSLELSKQQILDDLNIDEMDLKDKNIFISNRLFIEDIEILARKIQGLQLIIIDDIIQLKTKENYIFGYGDIRSIILQKLKWIAKEYNVKIVVIAPTKNNIQDKRQILNYFCNGERAEPYVDNIIKIDLFQKH